MTKYKTVAIGGIAGPNGSLISEEINTAIFETGKFKVIDREHLERIMHEQRMSVTDSFDERTAVRLGKLAGVQVFIFGTVADYKYKENKSYRRGTCGSGSERYPCTFYMRKGEANVKVGLRIVDTATGMVVAMKVVNGAATNTTNATDEEPPLIDGDSLLEIARGSAVSQFMAMIAPYEIDLTITLYKDSKIPTLATGIEYAKQGDWREAVNIFRDATNAAAENQELSDKQVSMAYYDYGIALGFIGRYDEGIKMVDHAFHLNPEPDYKQGKSMIVEFKKDAMKLKEQGVK